MISDLRNTAFIAKRQGSYQVAEEKKVALVFLYLGFAVGYTFALLLTSLAVDHLPLGLALSWIPIQITVMCVALYAVIKLRKE